MSLKVWLPLNGTLENKGISNIVPTNVNATVNSSGKIGSCYNFAGSGQRIKMTNPITNGINSFSICTWFYMTAASEALFGARTSGSGAGLLCFLYADRILFDDGARLTCNYNVNNLLNSWHHIACVKTPTQKIIYIDGVSIGSQNTTATTANIKNEITIGNDTYESYTGNDLKGKLNDFRIYDHCLSAAEVREISQGLILHYKLDTGNNLLRRVPKTYSPTAYNAYSFNLTENLQAGQTYTFQFWNVDVSHSAKTAAQTGIGVYWGGGSVGLKTMLGTSYFTNGHADYLSFTITITSTQANGSGAANAWLNIYNSPGSADGTRSMNIGMWKVEKGNIGTPWCLASDEGTVIEDSSGYNHNGTCSSTIAISSDTARYNGSIVFNGTTDVITITNQGLNKILNSACTISFWTKHLSESGGRSIYFSAYNGSPFWCLEKNANGAFRYDWNGTPDQYSANNVIVDNVWQHLCLVREGTAKAHFYLNGVLNKTFTTATTDLTNLVDTWRIGKDTRSNDGTPFHGHMSDFRIYCTALDAAAVKQLYELGAKVDNKGNIHGYEFVEKNAPKIYKTGIIEHKEVRESQDISVSATTVTYTPAANTNNSCSGNINVDFSPYQDLGKDIIIMFECDIAWNNLAAGTGGTFGIVLQGTNRARADNSWKWEGTNYVTGGYNFTSQVTANKTGTLHRKVTNKIPASWFNTYNGSRIQFRTNYSNGSGTATISNIKVSLSPIFKIDKEHIQSNQLIEI